VVTVCWQGLKIIFMRRGLIYHRDMSTGYVIWYNCLPRDAEETQHDCMLYLEHEQCTYCKYFDHVVVIFSFMYYRTQISCDMGYLFVSCAAET
jgi:hypothetical protein